MSSLSPAEPATGGHTQSPLIQVATGHGMLREGRADAALAAADAALAAEPLLVDGLLLRGAALKAMGRFADAVTALEAALARDPTRASAYVSLANAYAELDALPAAEAALRAALRLAPRLAAAHASLITVCARMGHDDLTEAACGDALVIDSQSVTAHQHLAELRARAGQHAAAQRHREAAYRHQNVFVTPALRPAPVALVPVTAEDGNIPLRYLLSRDRYTVIKWLVDYGPPDQAGRLPRHDFVFNAIGEPELPTATHMAVKRFARNCPVPFLNRPDRVARTSRIVLPDLLGDLPDVVVPPVVRWHADEPVPAVALPVLLRPVGAHGGTGLVRVATADALADAARPHAACDLTGFHDFAGPDGLYRKYRVIFIDRRPYPYHLAIGEDWLVHYVTALMQHHATRRAEEARFLADPAAALGGRAMAALAAIGKRLDLDYAGVDFSRLADGRVLVFEANATMVVHPETPGSAFDYKNTAVSAILAAFDTFVATRMHSSAATPPPTSSPRSGTFAPGRSRSAS